MGAGEPVAAERRRRAGGQRDDRQPPRESRPDGAAEQLAIAAGLRRATGPKQPPASEEGRALAADEGQSGLHRQEQALRTTHQRLKLVVAAEGGSELINGIGDGIGDGIGSGSGIGSGIGANRVGTGRRFGHATDGVIKQQAADPCASQGQVSPHPANQDNGHAGTARQFLGQIRGNIVQWDAVGRKRVEARDLAGAALDQDIAGGVLALDILRNRLAEVKVNMVIAAAEGRPFVLGEGF